MKRESSNRELQDLWEIDRDYIQDLTKERSEYAEMVMLLQEKIDLMSGTDAEEVDDYLPLDSDYVAGTGSYLSSEMVPSTPTSVSSVATPSWLLSPAPSVDS